MAKANLSELAGAAAPAKVPAFAKGAPARTVPVADIAANPLNKRKVTPEDAVEMAASLEEHGQMASAVVVTRAAFLKIFPGYQDKIKAAKYVQVTGARRLAGSIHGKRAGLEVQIKDWLAADQLTFLGATAAENLDRKNLNPIEEAEAIAEMCAVEGVQQKDVAAKLGRTAPWVTQRLNLLKLLPELQDRVLAGELPVSVGRDIGPLPAGEQMAAFEAYRAEKARKAAPATEEPVQPDEPDEQPKPDEPDDEAKPDEQPQAKPSPAQAAVKRLGGTGDKIAASLLEFLDEGELVKLVDALRAKLGR
jgi:ParB family chromosome partitioning protein